MVRCTKIRLPEATAANYRSRLTGSELPPNQVDLDHPLPRKVAVFGAGGKSSLARAISQKMNLKFIELDWINHMPGWQIRPPDDANRIVRERIESSPDGWIVDRAQAAVPNDILPASNAFAKTRMDTRDCLWRKHRDVLAALFYEGISNSLGHSEAMAVRDRIRSNNRRGPGRN